MKLLRVALLVGLVRIFVVIVAGLGNVAVFAQSGDEKNDVANLQHKQNVETLLVLMNMPAQVDQAALSWSNLKTTYIFTYSKRLDEREVAQIIDFYSSDAGKKLVAIQPESTLEIQRITDHLIKSDVQMPLAELAELLKEGLAKQRLLKASE